ncbi:MAG: YfjI family protein [Planctomycetaceae bacterium]
MMRSFKAHFSSHDTPKDSHAVGITSDFQAEHEVLSVSPTQQGGKKFISFPVEVLPGPCRDFVTANSKAIDCDSSWIASPMLSVMASAIGNTRRIRIKKSWEEPCNIWSVIVGGSGSRKSPGLDAAASPLRDRQSQSLKDNETLRKQYEADLAEYSAASKRYKGGSCPPEKPQEPIPERFIASDLTIEALAFLLHNQPRGLLVCRDELDGWFGGFDQYKSGRGSDVANWLELHGGRSLTVDRRTGNPRTIHIPRASVSLVGGIQPGILLPKIQGHTASGLIARLLLAFPPPRPRKWTDADVDQIVIDRYHRVVQNLLGLRFGEGKNQDPVPQIVELSYEARKRFAEFVNEQGEAQADLDDALTASFSKLEGYAARLGLVIHLARWASGEDVDSTVCDINSIEAGITLSKWFGNEATRIFSLLNETASEQEDRNLLDWVHKRGGKVTSRDLSKFNRKYPSAKDADSALQHLARISHDYSQTRVPRRS